MEMDDTLSSLAARVGEQLCRKGLLMATCESCTGGLVAAALTAIPGSSRWFDRGFVTYSNEAKQEVLGVQSTTLQLHGAVSEATTREMAEGGLRHSHARITLAVSGIAGPGGALPDKPVGMVCFAWAGSGLLSCSATHYFSGDRSSVRHQAVVTALQGVLDFLAGESHVV